MHRFRLQTCLIFLLLTSILTFAQTGNVTAKVVGVVDGDTVTIVLPSGSQQQVRLQGIDAPETSQPFGVGARAYLSSLILGKTIRLEWSKRDSYGRIVGKILLNGRDIGLEMIQAGLAWHYKQYESEQSIADRQLYAATETEARTSVHGLWQETTPIAPWDFREGGKSASEAQAQPSNIVSRPTGGIKLTGRVQEVMSGSCLKIVDQRNVPVDVCLRYAAAPELGQPAADLAKKHLEDLVLNQMVTTFVTAADEDEGFFIGEVITDRYNVGMQMVRDGVAWYYGEEAGNQSAEERSIYEQSELAARSERRGLWQETSPTPPWVYQARRSTSGSGTYGYSSGYGGYVGGSSSGAGKQVYVRGYYRSNGTYVHSYTRSLPGQGPSRGSGRGGSRGGGGRSSGGRGGRR